MVALALVRSGVLQRRHGSQARVLWNGFTNMKGNLHEQGGRGECRRPADGDHLMKNNEQRSTEEGRATRMGGRGSPWGRRPPGKCLADLSTNG